MYLLPWVQQREGSIHLCCRMLATQGLTEAAVTEIFNSVHVDCIQVPSLSCVFIDDLAFLNPYLRQTNNLLTLILDRKNHRYGQDGWFWRAWWGESRTLIFSASHILLSPGTLYKWCLFYRRQPERISQVRKDWEGPLDQRKHISLFFSFPWFYFIFHFVLFAS